MCWSEMSVGNDRTVAWTAPGGWWEFFPSRGPSLWRCYLRRAHCLPRYHISDQYLCRLQVPSLGQRGEFGRFFRLRYSLIRESASFCLASASNLQRVASVGFFFILRHRSQSRSASSWVRMKQMTRSEMFFIDRLSEVSHWTYSLKGLNIYFWK